MTKNAVVKAEESKLPAAYEYGDDAGAGYENTRSEDLSIPFISVLQAISPQVEDNPDVAKAGMLYNTVTGEFIDGDKGINFIPCHADVAFVEWVPRSKGGGFVGVHEPNSEVVTTAIKANGGNKFGSLKTGENELLETHYVYGLLLDESGSTTEGFALIAFTSTKIKPKKDWFTAMFTIKGKPPLFANRAKLTTVKQKNDQGTFYNFKIEPFKGIKEGWKASLIDPTKEKDLLDEARDFRNTVLKGMAKVDFNQQKATGEVQLDENGEAIPF